MNNNDIFLSEEESKRLFDSTARYLLGISGDEFLRRYEAGEFDEIEDTPDGRRVEFVRMLLPFVRVCT